MISITMPAPNERTEAIPILASHFLILHAARNDRVVDRFAPTALTALLEYA